MGEENTNNKIAWKTFLRQLLICSGSWTLLFMLGLMTGAPTVFIPQIQKEANSTAAVSDDIASWLRSSPLYAGMPWILILSFIIASKGPRTCQIIVAALTVLAYLVFYCSDNIYHILISYTLQGPLVTARLTIAIVSVAEYTSPKYRGLFATLQLATFYWGMLVSNLMGTFLHWRKIPLLGLICGVYALVTAFFWPQSPIWLAVRKRFDECASSHRWLKGSDKDSETELQRLISRYENINDMQPQSMKIRLLGIAKTFSTESFYKPVMLCLLITVACLFSGKFVTAIYAMEMLRQITTLESTAYTCMLVLDGVTVASMYVACFIARSVKRRTLLFVTSGIGITFLFAMSVYFYLIKLSVIEENSYVSIILLSGFSVAICCGPSTLSPCICGELLPLGSRTLSMCTLALIFKFIVATLLKLSPYIFKWFGMHGTFAFFAISMTVCVVFLYFYLPETKDKTLQEIADYFVSTNTPTIPIEENNRLIPVKVNSAVLTDTK